MKGRAAHDHDVIHCATSAYTRVNVCSHTSGLCGHVGCVCVSTIEFCHIATSVGCCLLPQAVC